MDAKDPERAAAEIISELEKLGALSPRVHQRRPIQAARRASKRGRDVWVMCESNLQGHITRGTLELLSRGDELASRLEGALGAVGFGAPIAHHAGLLASFGADRVLQVEHPALHPYTPAGAAGAGAPVGSSHAPWGILLGAPKRG